MDFPSPFATADSTRRTGGALLAVAGGLAALDNVSGLLAEPFAPTVGLAGSVLGAGAALAVLGAGVGIVAGRIDHRRYGMSAGFAAFLAAMWSSGVLAVVALPVALVGGGVLLSVPARNG